MPQYLVQFHHFCVNDEIGKANDNVARSATRPPACISARFQEGVFVFLNMRRISAAYAKFSVYSGDKEKLSENFEGRNAYEPI